MPNLRRTDNAVNQARRQLAIELNLDDLEGLRVTGTLASMDLDNPDENDAANREILTLGGINAVTEPVIAERKIQELKAALQELVKGT